MISVSPHDLIGQRFLDFDLYNEKGRLLFKKGEPIPPGLILELKANNQVLYRIDSVLKIEDFDLEPEPESKNSRPQSVFSEKRQEKLISNSKKLMQSIAEGKSIDIKSCSEANNILVDEVVSKIDKIKGINELKVFDKYTFSHTVNVSSMSTALGVILGLSDTQVSELALGALLHDVGKMLVPKEILLKPGKLEPEEFEIMKTHTTKGYEYIKAKNDVPERIAKVALEHQEKFGGFGYPNELKGEQISYYAQIVSVIDVYDALTSRRVYKMEMSNADALKLMIAEGSKSFNPIMLYRFIYIANYRNKSELVN